MEVLQKAEEHYKTRNFISVGGHLTLLGYFTLTNPYARLPIQFFLVPFFVGTLIVAMTELRHVEYSIPELTIVEMTPLFASFYAWVLTKKWVRIYKWDPLNPKGTPVSRPLETVSQILTRKEATTSPISQHQIDAMKKRNEKFQKKQAEKKDP